MLTTSAVIVLGLFALTGVFYLNAKPKTVERPQKRKYEDGGDDGGGGIIMSSSTSASDSSGTDGVSCDAGVDGGGD